MCVCVRLHTLYVCTGAHIHVFVYMWRSEVGTGQLLLLISTLSFEIQYLIQPGAHDLARLAGQQVQGAMTSPLYVGWLQEPTIVLHSS